MGRPVITSQKKWLIGPIGAKVGLCGKKFGTCFNKTAARRVLTTIKFSESTSLMGTKHNSTRRFKA